MQRRDMSMDKQIILMCKNKEVARMSTDGWEISLPDLLPKNLRVTSPKNPETLLSPTFSSDFIGWCASP